MVVNGFVHRSSGLACNREICGGSPGYSISYLASACSMNFIRFSDFSFSDTVVGSSARSSPHVPEFQDRAESVAIIAAATMIHAELYRFDHRSARSRFISTTPG